MKIKQYKVEKGIATPVNPFICSEMFYVPCRELPDGENCLGCNDHISFEKLIQAHTYATNAQDGVYDADCFSLPVWQFQYKGPKGITWGENSEFRVKEMNKEDGVPIRQLLQINPIPKMETTEFPSPENTPTCEDKGEYCMGKYKEYCKVCLKNPSPEKGVKTAIEVLEEVSKKEQRSSWGDNLKIGDNITHHIVLDAMEIYANQFKPTTNENN